MYIERKNEYGCSLEDQDGRMAVRDFDGVIARLSPELRAAFEAERAERRAELEALRAAEAEQRRARVGRVAGAIRRRVRFTRVLRRFREVGSAGLVGKPVVRMIVRHRAARHEAGGHAIAGRVLPESDLGAPASLGARYAASRRACDRWLRAAFGGSRPCASSLRSALWRAGRYPHHSSIGSWRHIVDIKFISH